MCRYKYISKVSDTYTVSDTKGLKIGNVTSTNLGLRNHAIQFLRIEEVMKTFPYFSNDPFDRMSPS